MQIMIMILILLMMTMMMMMMINDDNVKETSQDINYFSGV